MMNGVYIQPYFREMTWRDKSAYCGYKYEIDEVGNIWSISDEMLIFR